MTEPVNDVSLLDVEGEPEEAPVAQVPDVNAAAGASLGSCDGNCGWEELHDRIETMLADERYGFAEETLQGISDWVFEHEHATDAQKQAVQNIAASVYD